MAFPLEILVSGIKLANTLTSGVQVPIGWEAFVGEDAMGAATYAPKVTLMAVYDDNDKQYAVPGGEVVNIDCTLTIVGDVPANGAVTSPPRNEPIDTRDRITLPTNLTYPIVAAPSSVINPSTNRGLIQQIVLGPRTASGK